MDLNGQLILAFLQEDDARRVLFRVRPLLTEHGAFPPEEVEELKNEGYLRIAPDRLEQYTFKERMRSLGSLCLINLVGTDAALGKVRPNKNYAPDRNEPNRYIIYSDAITALPEDLLYEVVSEDKSAGALTGQYYLRSGGRISGPYCKSGTLSCPASHTLMPDNDRLFLVEMPDKTNRMFYWPQTEESGVDQVPAIGTRTQPEPPVVTPQSHDEPGSQGEGAGDMSELSVKLYFVLAAEGLMRALRTSGFVIDEKTAEQALVLLAYSKKVQLAGDCLADAHLAEKIIKSLLPESFCHELICSGPDIFVKQDDFQKRPWPLLRLTSGDGVPANRDFDLLDEKELLSTFGKADIKQDEQLQLFDRLHSQVKAQGQALPLCFRRDLMDYLNHAARLTGLYEEDILAFAWTVFAEPWLQRQNPQVKSSEP